jgi:hypothetical protein
MPVTVRNTLNTTLDVPGAGLIFDPGETKSVDAIGPALSAAIQSGRLAVVDQSATSHIVVEEDGQTEFDLPFAWPGPEHAHLTVGGLLQHFGADWTVDAAANRLLWLDSEIELKAGDRLVFVGRW